MDEVVGLSLYVKDALNVFQTNPDTSTNFCRFELTVPNHAIYRRLGDGEDMGCFRFVY